MSHVTNPFLKMPSLATSQTELCRRGEDFLNTLDQIDFDRLDDEALRELDDISSGLHNFGYGS